MMNQLSLTNPNDAYAAGIFLSMAGKDGKIKPNLREKVVGKWGEGRVKRIEKIIALDLEYSSTYDKLNFEKSINMAKSLGHEYITIEHIIFGSMNDEGSYKLLESFGADVKFIKTNIEH